MTREQLDNVQKIGFFMLDGTAVFLPGIQPFVSAIESIFLAAKNHGVIPVEVSQEQLNAIGAGIAAAKASAVTSHMAKAYPIDSRDCRCLPGDGHCKMCGADD